MVNPSVWRTLIKNLLDIRVAEANVRDGKNVAPKWNRKDIYNLTPQRKWDELYKYLDNFWAKKG